MPTEEEKALLGKKLLDLDGYKYLSESSGSNPTKDQMIATIYKPIMSINGNGLLWSNSPGANSVYAALTQEHQYGEIYNISDIIDDDIKTNFAALYQMVQAAETTKNHAKVHIKAEEELGLDMIIYYPSLTASLMQLIAII